MTFRRRMIVWLKKSYLAQNQMNTIKIYHSKYGSVMYNTNTILESWEERQTEQPRHTNSQDTSELRESMEKQKPVKFVLTRMWVPHDTYGGV